MHDAALEKLALITGWMRSSGLTFTELTPPQQAREVLAERGITGRPWTWGADSLKSLLINGVF